MRYQKPVESSLIATLDILGTTSMMLESRTDTLSELAYSLETAFDTAIQETNQIVLALDENSCKGLRLKDALKIQVFSDTIVISCNFSPIIQKIPLLERTKHKEFFLMVYGFFVCVKYIALSLFKAGYPTRGCITSGTIITTKNFTIGKPFVESLLISKDLDFAGIVVSASAKLIYDIIATYLTVLSRHVPIEKHLIRCKNKKRKRLNCMNFLDSPRDKFLVSELPLIFTAHGKRLSDVVYEKMINTKKLLRAFLSSINFYNCKS